MQNRKLKYIGNDRFDIELSNINENVKKDEVLLKILYCGICGSDLGYMLVSNHDRNNPIVLGHEMVGEIIKIGESITEFKVGDIVVANPGESCGKCEFCIEGKVNMCPNTKFTGFPPFDGFLQEYIHYPVKNLYKVNIENVIYATLVEPLAVCLHSLELANFKFGMTAFIAGSGGIGSGLIYLLKKYGCYKVVVSEPNDYRRKIALKLGADFVVDPTNKSSEEIFQEMKIHGIKEVDRYFEASGNVEALKNSTRLTKIGGQVIVIGIPTNDEFCICHSEARKKALTFKMERTIKNNIPEAIKILENDDTLQLLINNYLTMDEFKESFKLIRQNKIDSTRIVVKL